MTVLHLLSPKQGPGLYGACLLALLLLPRPSLQAQPSASASDIRITDVRLVDGQRLVVDYWRTGQKAQGVYPVDVLAALVHRIPSSDPVHPGLPAKRPSGFSDKGDPGENLLIRGQAELFSPATGLTYKVDMIADSLVQIRYETPTGKYQMDLPGDAFSVMSSAFSALSGVGGPEVNEAYVNLETGKVWFSIRQVLSLWQVLAVLVMGVLAITLGPAVLYIERQRREKQALVASQQLRFSAREKERVHLAGELHDGPIQVLQAIRRDHLSPLLKALNTELIRLRLDDIGETLEKVIGDLRGICSALRPHVLVHFGLDIAIKDDAETFRKRNPDLAVTLDLDRENKTLPMLARLALYRIVQEALTNIGKYAQAQHIWITLKLDADEVLLTIRDDGQGFSVPKRLIDLERKGHLGLANMATRAETIGGTLKINSAPGKGTLLHVVVPLPISENVTSLFGEA